MESGCGFGIGFGGFEAMVIGFISFLNLLLFFLIPEIMSSLPTELQMLVQAQLNVDTLFIFPAIIERIAVIFTHVFASVLVVLAVNSKKSKYFWYSFAYKAVLDGMIPALLIIIGLDSLLSTYLIEIPVIVMAVIGYFGLRLLKPRFKSS